MAKIENIKLNSTFLKFRKRAEKISREQLVATFVNVGLMYEILSNEDHQIIYGRRGTGKTHAIRYLADRCVEDGDIAIYIDISNLGSDTSIYNDHELTVSERAVRLLTDVLATMHDGFIEQVSDRPDIDLVKFNGLMEDFSQSLPTIKVVGATEVEATDVNEQNKKSTLSAGLSKATGPTINVGSENADKSASTVREKHSGTQRYSVKFPALGRTISAVASFLLPRRVWLLVDEWSSLPEDIQPFLADMLRRSFFSVSPITVKIAAIEHRSKFYIDGIGGQYTGFELGADIGSSMNLDNYLVFDNDEARAKSFFADLLFRHVKSIATERGTLTSDTPSELIRNAFTQDNVFAQFVRASEGVPRDAMYIIATAAQKASDKQISMPNIRQAAHAFFQSDKLNVIQSNPILSKLLAYIIREVIGDRKTSAFLIEVGKSDENINKLFDRRILHVKSRNESSRDHPGKRYVVYKIDYGCYIDLVYTKKFPNDLDLSAEIPIDDPCNDDLSVSEQKSDKNLGSIEVPLDDKRSYRRAILDLEKFYSVVRDGYNVTI